MSLMNNRIIMCINAYAKRWCVEWAGDVGTIDSASVIGDL